MIGRTNERKLLDETFQSPQSELVAVYGRRRIGKTFLVREHFGERLTFSFSGLYQGTLTEHLREFAKALQHIQQSPLLVRQPADWFEAFGLLQIWLESLPNTAKKVLFLDELPWMATPKSRFLTAFESFWNSWAAPRKDIVVVICGSAAAWMIQRIERSKGGLYNRVTRRIVLHAFTLTETELFLQSKGIYLSRRHVVELYMAVGGVPHYLNQIAVGQTPPVAIEQLFFSPNGLLKDEFDPLFDSLFGEGGLHKQIVQVLCQHRYGLRRDALLQKLHQPSSGWFSNILDELVASGFVEIQVPYTKKSNDGLIKVIDNFSLFYVNFKQKLSLQTYQGAQNTPQWRTWSGLSFENICLYHKQQLSRALGISGIHCTYSTWYHKGNDTLPGAQIDLVIERADKALHICEIKFNEQPFVVTKAYSQEVRNKIASFEYFTQNRKTVFCTFITTGGVFPNPVAKELVQIELGLDDLFA